MPGVLLLLLALAFTLCSPSFHRLQQLLLSCLLLRRDHIMLGQLRVCLFPVGSHAAGLKLRH
jgi:hypothetical protein